MSLSDHLYIYFELDIEIMENKDFICKTNRSNFTYFNNIFKNCEKNIMDIYEGTNNFQELDKLMNYLVEIMVFAQKCEFRKKPLRRKIKTN